MGSINSDDVSFGDDTKSNTTLNNQMENRGWTTDSVKDVIDNPYITRTSTDLATGNQSTAFYTQDGAYVVVDSITLDIVQVSDALNPIQWIPDSNIIDPYTPWK